jgi:ABC-type phosphate transport system permease subunit
MEWLLYVLVFAIGVAAGYFLQFYRNSERFKANTRTTKKR